MSDGFFQGGGTSTASNPNPQSEKRTLKMISALIQHPKHGLILYEVGAAPNARELWGDHLFDVFPVTRYEDANRLDRAINACGFDISDVKAVIIGHLHIDHAGGLEFFRNRSVPIYVHEDELKYAFYAVATKEDIGPCLGHYLDFSFEWRTVSGEVIELFDDITLVHTPGHTPGLLGMLLELKNAGPFYFTSDMFFFKENYDGHVQGWLLRDHAAWHRSRKKIQRLVEMRDPNLVFGHDPETLSRFYKTPEFYD
jgi:glyoxylase-like metal-dependent hydrolase (beta-lactamase superfamily II)